MNNYDLLFLEKSIKLKGSLVILNYLSKNKGGVMWLDLFEGADLKQASFKNAIDRLLANEFIIKDNNEYFLGKNSYLIGGVVE